MNFQMEEAVEDDDRRSERTHASFRPLRPRLSEAANQVQITNTGKQGFSYGVSVLEPIRWATETALDAERCPVSPSCCPVISLETLAKRQSVSGPSDTTQRRSVCCCCTGDVEEAKIEKFQAGEAVSAHFP